jgi:hypothetical protein
LNLQPADYKSAALPLSYASLLPINVHASANAVNPPLKSAAERTTYDWLSCLTTEPIRG